MIDLAMRRSRQLIHPHDDGRHHIAGQALLQCTLCTVGHLSRVIFCRHIGDQPGAGRSALQRDTRLARGGQRQQLCFDFTEFNPVTSELYLTIAAAQILHISAGKTTGTVTCPVHAAARQAERIRNETFCSQCRALKITARKTTATDVQLALHAIRNNIEITIEHICDSVTDRLADGRISRSTGGTGRCRP